MLDNLFTDRKLETENNYNQKKTIDIFGTHDETRSIGDINTQKTVIDLFMEFKCLPEQSQRRMLNRQKLLGARKVVKCLDYSQLFHKKDFWLRKKTNKNRERK